MANEVWKYLKQLSINLIARIMNFSEVGWPQGLLALEFCLLAYINYIFKASLKIRSSQSSNIPEFPMINQKSKIVRDKCGRDILLYNVNYRSTLDLVIWIFRDLWQKNMETLTKIKTCYYYYKNILFTLVFFPLVCLYFPHTKSIWCKLESP